MYYASININGKIVILLKAYYSIKFFIILLKKCFNTSTKIFHRLYLFSTLLLNLQSRWPPSRKSDYYS